MSKSTVEMVSLRELQGRLAFDFPDMPSSVIEDAIVCGAQKLAQRPLMQVWINLTPQLQVGEDLYDFQRHIPDELELSGITAVKHCGCCIPDIKDKCDDCSCGWRLCDTGTIQMQPPISSKSDTLEICVNLRPTSDACNLPKILVDRYWKVIRDLARAELALMPNQSTTNVRYANLMERRAMGDIRSIMGNVSNNGKQGGKKATAGMRWLFGSTKKNRV